jgi:hypothetical protein
MQRSSRAGVDFSCFIQTKGRPVSGRPTITSSEVTNLSASLSIALAKLP